MTPLTLKKYGLTQEDFDRILANQGGVCAICKKVPSTGRWVIDHVHIRGYKRLKPEKRQLWVRGVLCGHCNRFYLAKGMTAAKASNLLSYLEAFQGPLEALPGSGPGLPAGQPPPSSSGHSAQALAASLSSTGLQSTAPS